MAQSRYEPGRWDSSRLVWDIQSKRFRLIILNAEPYPAPVLAAVGRFYYVVENIPLAAATYHIFPPAFPGWAMARAGPGCQQPRLP